MNTNPTQLILYHTAGCHLCDEARQLLAPIPEIAVTETDIAKDSALVEHYGTRIPVLLRPDTESTLDWPFTAEAIVQWINEPQ
jgi:hypothetical protein